VTKSASPSFRIAPGVLGGNIFCFYLLLFSSFSRCVDMDIPFGICVFLGRSGYWPFFPHVPSRISCSFLFSCFPLYLPFTNCFPTQQGHNFRPYLPSSMELFFGHPLVSRPLPSPNRHIICPFSSTNTPLETPSLACFWTAFIGLIP